ncbi:PVC-type heme-binding CxxCH protein [Pedobacter sp. CG_S7]|uniref:PVC-type heme-binding CxxCH protein n=1 Tax=Pedobacter sp. CG_S7 TaxID=3143930 RepID=UPI0033921484
MIDTPLTDKQKHLPENALKSLLVAPGLKVQTMATEPMLINPTNIDVDERGRVWVTEAYNYRFEINKNKPRPEGDRILILEDKDGDGVMETSKVFYQGPEMNAPLGICVLGNRVLVSQSPYVWAFYDDNGDDKADRKEILFQGIGGEQHDHGMHTFVFGPDGKLYFNFGNSGLTLKDKNNKVVLDQDGDEIGPKKYKDGMLFRSDPDGSNVECLGYNFRNPYEPAVDSYGNIWQSDNDDDGNKGVRINYIIEYGNFGFKDEMTGATWSTNRVNLEDSIPVRHWHQNDPGVIPNLLQTGSGSPTGMVIYEGSLLPKQFQDQIIHAEPGHNVVRSYPVKKNAAGFSAGIINILTDDKDQWFRPSDVCVAPDGSLIIADWYDPGVGGHRIGDLQRGRIYRVTSEASSSTYKMLVQDYDTPEGAINALQNPNLAVRHHAFIALQEMGTKAIHGLEKLWRSSPNPRMRARALWVLSKSPNAKKYLSEAIKDLNPDLRITGLRAARQVNINVINYVKELINDSDPQVRRACAIALRHNKTPEAANLWASLAAQNDGNDRWYLEALGIGADKQWDSFLAAYLKKVKSPLLTAGGRDIIWRARTDNTLPFLAQLASDANVPMRSRLRYFRAFDFISGSEKTRTLLRLLEENNSKDIEMSTIVLRLLDAKDAANSPVVAIAIKNVLNAYSGTQEYLNLLRQYGITTEGAKLLDMVIAKGKDPIGVDAARLIFESKDGQRFRDIISTKEPSKTLNVLAALGIVGNTESVEILSGVALSESYSQAFRQKAIEVLGKSRAGEDRVMELLRGKKLPADLIPPVVSGLSETRTKAVYEEAKTFLSSASKAKPEKKALIINFKELLALTGSAAKGKGVFNKTCSACHQANGQGYDFGPNLSEIASKLPKEGLFDAIINPSAGINFGYETWQIDMKDGSNLQGIISNRTKTDIELKYPGGATQKIKTNDVKMLKELPGSMMPEGLHEILSKQELVDLVQYLSLLKKKE